jgi:hypothetical protein
MNAPTIIMRATLLIPADQPPSPDQNKATDQASALIKSEGGKTNLAHSDDNNIRPSREIAIDNSGKYPDCSP